MFKYILLICLGFCLDYPVKDILKCCFSIYFGLILVRIFYWLYKVTLRNRKNLKAEYGSNSWAIVIGSTDGIGKAFAEELAISGFNVILVARNEEKLLKVANEIRKLNPEIKVTIVTFDFGINTKVEDYQRAFKEIMEYDISILVNNVGITMRTKFDALTLEEIKNYVDLNVIPQAMMTKLFLANMLKRKRSAVIDLSSTASTFAAPDRFSLYGSTKIYNDYLSVSLGEKHKDKIDFLSVLPMMVESNQTNYKRNGLSVVSSKQCVNGCLDALGYEIRTNGHWIHQILGCLLRSIPESLFLQLTSLAVTIMKKNKTK